jgi:hypothetical protein
LEKKRENELDGITFIPLTNSRRKELEKIQKKQKK